jgi:acetyltransferase-like isoleucine patch superfamily enzyme
MNYSHDELKQILGSVGDNVTVHRSVVFFSPQNIYIGSSVRIDCYSFLSAGPKGIQIGDFVHLGVGVCLFGASGQIQIESFCGLSSKATVLTGSDDYTEGYLTNPTVPTRYKKVREGDVVLRKHALVGVSSVIMPGVTLGVAASVGALSFVNGNVPDFAIALGNPLRLFGKRPARILELERECLSEVENRNGDEPSNGAS